MVPVGVVDVVTVPVGVAVAPLRIGAVGFLGAVLLSEQAKGKITPERTTANANIFLTFRCFFIFRLDKNT
jgi:hypothetical protein